MKQHFGTIKLFADRAAALTDPPLPSGNGDISPPPSLLPSLPQEEGGGMRTVRSTSSFHQTPAPDLGPNPLLSAPLYKLRSRALTDIYSRAPASETSPGTALRVSQGLLVGASPPASPSMAPERQPGGGGASQLATPTAPAMGSPPEVAFAAAISSDDELYLLLWKVNSGLRGEAGDVKE